MGLFFLDYLHLFEDDRQGQGEEQAVDAGTKLKLRFAPNSYQQCQERLSQNSKRCIRCPTLIFCDHYSRCILFSYRSQRVVYGQAAVHPSPRRSQSERHPPGVRHLPQHCPRRSHRRDKPRAEEPNWPGGQCIQFLLPCG